MSSVLRPLIGNSPASSAPRSPARRGIQPIRAPVEVANSETAVSKPGVVAARSPTKIMLPDSVISLADPATAAGAACGAVAIKVPPTLPKPVVAYGATA